MGVAGCMGVWLCVCMGSTYRRAERAARGEGRDLGAAREKGYLERVAVHAGAE